ncbi:MAG: nuclease-related domain-containing protein [Solirubrobacteraceae bacterium]
MARLIDEPASTRAWQQGARGEMRTAERLAKHLKDRGVRVLHDRRVPGHGRANIDHIAVGASGVLVIDTKTHRGHIKTERIGGLFAPRRTVLRGPVESGQTHLIDGVEHQMGYVGTALADASVPVRGALCFPHVDDLSLLSHLSVRDILIDGPKPIAKLARQPGPLTDDAIEEIWLRLGRAFPVA